MEILVSSKQSSLPRRKDFITLRTERSPETEATVVGNNRGSNRVHLRRRRRHRRSRSSGHPGFGAFPNPSSTSSPAAHVLTSHHRPGPAPGDVTLFAESEERGSATTAAPTGAKAAQPFFSEVGQQAQRLRRSFGRPLCKVRPLSMRISISICSFWKTTLHIDAQCRNISHNNNKMQHST